MPDFKAGYRVSRQRMKFQRYNLYVQYLRIQCFSIIDNARVTSQRHSFLIIMFDKINFAISITNNQ